LNKYKTKLFKHGVFRNQNNATKIARKSFLDQCVDCGVSYCHIHVMNMYDRWSKTLVDVRPNHLVVFTKWCQSASPPPGPDLAGGRPKAQLQYSPVEAKYYSVSVKGLLNCTVVKHRAE